MIKAKDGFQICPRCSGDRCYHCQRKGTILQCPNCGNREPSLIPKRGNKYTCYCGTTFSESGEVLAFDNT